MDVNGLARTAPVGVDPRREVPAEAQARTNRQTVVGREEGPGDRVEFSPEGLAETRRIQEGGKDPVASGAQTAARDQRAAEEQAAERAATVPAPVTGIDLKA
jgi:hypothetical protein